MTNLHPVFRLFLCLFVGIPALMRAQPGSHFLTLGPDFVILSDGQHVGDNLLGGGVHYGYQFNNMVVAGCGISSARSVGGRADESGASSRQLSHVDVGLRCYPNKKAKGFYAGASMALYRIGFKQNEVREKSTHFGSHIQFGALSPLNKHFYLQTGVQAGVIYDYAVRYGVNVAAVWRL